MNINQNIEIYNDDCLIKMQDIPDASVDMILCDLPYGTTSCKWDNIIPFDKLWEQYKRIIKPYGTIALFGSEPFSSKLRMSNIKNFRYDWIWDKKNCGNPLNAKKQPLKQHEIISIFSYRNNGNNSKGHVIYYPQGLKNTYIQRKNVKKPLICHEHTLGSWVSLKTNYPRSIITYSKVTSKSNHPTEKPVPLLEYLIKTYTNEGEVVLDNCMGSGSTGVACVNLNRKFIGIELEEEYFNISKKRIEDAVNNKN